MKYSARLEIFEQARSKYGPFLTSVLWKLTNNKELFAEAMQYAMLAMWRYVEKLDGQKASAYIYRIALTANSKAWRNRVGRNGQISDSYLSCGKSPVENTNNAETARTVRQAIAQLPPKQGIAIAARYLEQKSYEDVAHQLGCSQAAARSHVSHAIKALKNKFADSVKQEQ